MATNTVTENVVFGYASGGDSPAYSKNLTTNAVSTYLGLVNYTGTTGSWPIRNAHGDTVGVTDVNATFVANAPTDEYGRGVAPANRLGWLGAHYRFNIGGTQNLTRMGVRLYDPNLGRFLQVDPIEGSNANDYDYVAGDPVNGFDLTGTHKRKCWTWGVGCKAHNAKHTAGRAVATAKSVAETMYRTTGIPLGGGVTLRKDDGEFDRGVCRAASTFNGATEGPASWVAGTGFMAALAKAGGPVATAATKVSGRITLVGVFSFFVDAGCRVAGK